MSLVDYGFYSDEEEEETLEGRDGPTGLEEANESGVPAGIVGDDGGVTPPPGAASRSVSSRVAPRGVPDDSGTQIDYEDMEEDGPSVERASDPTEDSDAGALAKGDSHRLRVRTALSASGDLHTDCHPVDGSVADVSDDEAPQQNTSGARRAHDRQIFSGRPPTEGHVSLMPQAPAGDVPQELLRTVERLQQLKRRGITVNGNIAASLDFKNPYLLEKIMKVFDIDPYCSNYPASVFDPARVTPWEPEGGVSFAVHLMRRFESRRQLTRRTDSHAGRETERATPPLPVSVPSVPLAVGAAASTASASNVVPLPATTSEFILGATNGSTRRSHSRSGLERISPPASRQADQTVPQSGSAAASSAMAAAAQLSAVIQQAALKAAAAQAGAVASSLQQQLQQRLLSGQTGFVHQKPLLETQSAAAAAAIAARNHVGGQLNGPGMNINFSQQRSVFVPSPSGAAGHGSEPGWTGRAGNEGDANAKKRSRDGMGTTASKPHPTS
ncbi:HCNGP-like family protein, related [Neospora caninum Liverpool]|uniref:HCNGP-like family protein, related n=1 Tax=Neospora caninum (strain Liverpool) TaxID=572307 RepID=F0VPZ7_NEOCL|nr:HCNGP-like family protein, related [Neospora caninum Liverpool]CBZ55794.1 HCNGP-like family protein, related [Neospora caninum Liverpool]CEL70537.1 TPA: HCNGP-like family protein, related [Neospora caninum Liverpool]|eukprot:XP_003885820.1 HCNGP-like family protein, related [Neospora caninum Liverpool]